MPADRASSRTVTNFMEWAPGSGYGRGGVEVPWVAELHSAGKTRVPPPNHANVGRAGGPRRPPPTWVPGTEKDRGQTSGFTICTNWNGAFIRAGSGASMRPVER